MPWTKFNACYRDHRACDVFVLVFGHYCKSIYFFNTRLQLKFQALKLDAYCHLKIRLERVPEINFKLRRNVLFCYFETASYVNIACITPVYSWCIEMQKVKTKQNKKIWFCFLKKQKLKQDLSPLKQDIRNWQNYGVLYRINISSHQECLLGFTEWVVILIQGSVLFMQN